MIKKCKPQNIKIQCRCFKIAKLINSNFDFAQSDGHSEYQVFKDYLGSFHFSKYNLFIYSRLIKYRSIYFHS